MENESTAGVWSSLLRESSTRSSMAIDKASCVIVGENDAGKSTLLGKLTSNSTSDVNETIKKQGNHVVKDVLSYGYLDVEEGLLDTSYLSRVNFWTMSNEAFADTVLHGDRTVYVVAVDASQPDGCLELAKKWLYIVRQLASQRPGNSTADNQTEHTQWNDMGKQIPIILVASKCEVVKVDDAASLKRAKELQGQLRELGLLVGATVVYVSSAMDINVARLKRYILHRLYPEVITLATEASSSSIEDGITTAFVPAGTDNATMISIATGYQIQNSHEYLKSLDELASRYVPSTTGAMRSVQGVGEEKTATSESSTSQAYPAATAGVAGSTVGTVELEDEEEWLTGLQNYIAQVTATSSGGVASSSSSSSSSKGVLPTSAASQSQQSSSSSSSSLLSNVNSSMASGNEGGTVTGTGTGTEKDKKGDRKGDKKGSDPLPPPAPGSAPVAASVASAVEGRSTRRSARTLAGQQANTNPSSSQPKEEVGDFFKNLLLMGTPAPPASQSSSSTAVDDGNKKK